MIISSPAWVLGFIAEGSDTIWGVLGILATLAYGIFGVVLFFAFKKHEESEKVLKLASRMGIAYLLPAVFVGSVVVYKL